MMRIPQLTPDQLDSNGRGYPRPQLRRDAWWSLNGEWDFAIDPPGLWRHPDHVDWSDTVEVPFSPETAASGIENTGFYRACWYRRRIETPVLLPGQRLVLHFGAVDYQATVWVNATWVGEHLGGYTPFSFDITQHAIALGECEIVVRAEDDPHDLAKPRGKQDWQLEPHSIWYPRTTGIWQTVWMEVVPRTHVASLRWTSNVRKWQITLQARVHGPDRDGTRLAVTLRKGDRVLTEDVYQVHRGEVVRTITLADPGIDDARNDLLWWPWAPNLIDAELRLLDASDK